MLALGILYEESSFLIRDLQVLSPTGLNHANLLHIVLELTHDLRGRCDDFQEAVLTLCVIGCIALLMLVTQAFASVDFVPSAQETIDFEV